MIKLLIADDEADTSNAIRRMIPWHNYDIELCPEAANGREAIESITFHQPDIALLDVRMPVIDGLGVVKYIHENKLDIKTIILSGYDEFTYAQTALRYGSSDYLLKPCRQEDLLKSILQCKDQLLQSREQQHLCHSIKQTTFTDVREPDAQKCMTEPDPHQMFNHPVKNILEAVRTGKIEEASERTEKLFSDFAAYSCDKNMVLNDILSLMLGMDRICVECSIQPPPGLFSLLEYKHLTCFFSLKDLKEAVNTVLKEVTKRIYDKTGKSVSVQAAIHYIRQHYAENIDLKLLSEQIHVTPAYLSLLFKSQTGVNYLEYLTRCRIEQACILLAGTALKNYEIAYKTGFRDEKYFSTVFKKFTGMTPSRYRKIHS